MHIGTPLGEMGALSLARLYHPCCNIAQPKCYATARKRASSALGRHSAQIAAPMHARYGYQRNLHNSLHLPISCALTFTLTGARLLIANRSTLLHARPVGRAVSHRTDTGTRRLAPRVGRAQSQDVRDDPMSKPRKRCRRKELPRFPITFRCWYGNRRDRACSKPM